MFGVGLPEMAVIVLVAIIVFGPDKLPEFARQAGRFIRELRAFSQRTRNEIRDELGPEFADFDVEDLNPRRLVQKHILDDLEDDLDDTPSSRARERDRRDRVADGEPPPYDAEAT